MLLHLDFHHHSILVRSTEEALIQKLKDEFHFFVSEEGSSPETVIDLLLEAPEELPSMIAVKLLEQASVYQLGHVQYVDYFGEALTIWNELEKKVQISSLHQDRLFELAFLAVHSILGQELDRDGLCRVHALSVSLHQTNALVMLPSKGGKSTLLTHLLENPEVKIISDDMPLVSREGRVFPFPSKISLSEIPSRAPLSELTWHEFKRHHYPTKWTASLSQLKERIELNSSENSTLLIAGMRLSSGQSILSEVPKWKMILPLMEHMIMGFGLPQVLEMFLKFNFTDIFKMGRHAFHRSVSAFNLVRNSKCFYFYLGPDKAYNAQLLLDCMYEHQNS